MAVFDPSHVKVGPGTLYVAPLGSTEPTAVTGAWDAAWTEVGYTDAGSDFDLTPTVTDIEVEEEYWAVDTSITGYKGSLTFALAEPTAKNLGIALNLGLTPAGASQGTNGDGSIWTEPPDIGNEVFVMLGWDALPKGSTSGDGFMRLICRRTLQTGAVKMTHRKGNNKLMYAVTFSILKPSGKQPFRIIQPASLAA